MRVSAENVLRGTITEITEGAVDGLVKLDVNGQIITANISKHAIDTLRLRPGLAAAAIIKADDVMMASEPRYALSARNQISGTIAAIQKGAVNALVTIEAPDDLVIVASTTWHSIQEMELRPGSHVTAVIKAAAVMIALEA